MSTSGGASVGALLLRSRRRRRRGTRGDGSVDADGSCSTDDDDERRSDDRSLLPSSSLADGDADADDDDDDEEPELCCSTSRMRSNVSGERSARKQYASTSARALSDATRADSSLAAVFGASTVAGPLPPPLDALVVLLVAVPLASRAPTLMMCVDGRRRTPAPKLPPPVPNPLV